MLSLDLLPLNKEGKINKIKGEPNLKRRLLDLGFIPGTKIKCVLISPFSSPHAYLIDNSIYALRNIDARNIEVIYE